MSLGCVFSILCEASEMMLALNPTPLPTLCLALSPSPWADCKWLVVSALFSLLDHTRRPVLRMTSSEQAKYARRCVCKWLLTDSDLASAFATYDRNGSGTRSPLLPSICVPLYVYRKARACTRHDVPRAVCVDWPRCL